MSRTVSTMTASLIERAAGRVDRHAR